jgi:predicted metal-dependent phosphoesterase TrpH
VTTEKRGKADLHIHTSFSDGMASARELLDHVETETDLDVIAVTDHETCAGPGHETVGARNYRFELVTGAGDDDQGTWRCSWTTA